MGLDHFLRRGVEGDSVEEMSKEIAGSDSAQVPLQLGGD